MVRIVKQLDPNPGGEGGGTGGNTGGTGNGEGGANPEAVVAQETQQLEALLKKTPETLTEQEKTTLTTLRTKYNVEEVDDEGKPITPEKKAEIEKNNQRLTAIKAKPEAQRTAEESKFLLDNTQVEKTIYEQVDELSGVPVAVEYGDTDPLSAEGVIKREEAIRDQAVEEYDARLKNDFPEAYRYLQHMQAGGAASEFFQAEQEDFSSITLTKTDIGTQETVFRKALSLKGNTPDQIDALIQMAKDKGKLFEQSKSELEALQAKQQADKVKQDQKQQQQEQQKKQAVLGFYNQLGEILDKGVNGVVIPLAERRKFADFIGANIFYREGRLVYAREIDPKSILDEIAVNYFRFKKGDLSKVVESRANNLNVQKIKGQIKYKVTPKTSGDSKPVNMPLGAI